MINVKHSLQKVLRSQLKLDTTFANKSLGKSMFPLEAVAGIALRNDTIP